MIATKITAVTLNITFQIHLWQKNINVWTLLQYVNNYKYLQIFK